MKSANYAVAAVAASMMMPAVADAAVVVRIDAFATGLVTDYYLDGSKTVFEESRRFTFDEGSGLLIGQSQSFQIGPNSNAGVAYGTITRVADDRYGNQAFVGSNFLYSRLTYPDTMGHAQDTTLKAATFTVRQIIPAPVPEPATWMTMILGFGVVGYAMRRRTITFNRHPLV